MRRRESSSAEKELWKCRGGGKSGKPNPGFPLFPPPLGNLANPARFPHSHSSGGSRLEKWKTKIRFPTFPHATRDDDDYSFRKVKIKGKTQNQSRRLRRPVVGHGTRNLIRKETLSGGVVALLLQAHSSMRKCCTPARVQHTPKCRHTMPP